MVPIFDPPPPQRGDTQQQLDDLRKWANMLYQKLIALAAEVDSGSSTNS